jgi:acetyl-CoA synthetase
MVPWQIGPPHHSTRRIYVERVRDMSETLSNLAREERRFEPPADLAATPTSRRRPMTGPPRTTRRSGPKPPSVSTGARSGTRSSTGRTLPSPSGSSAGTINAAVNCADRHVEAGNGRQVALHWVGEPADDARDITYSDLKDEVCRAANALTELGVRKGDRVAIYMPMIPEVVVAMLAVRRLGRSPHGRLRRVSRPTRSPPG